MEKSVLVPYDKYRRILSELDSKVAGGKVEIPFETTETVQPGPTVEKTPTSRKVSEGRTVDEAMKVYLPEREEINEVSRNLKNKMVGDVIYLRTGYRSE